MKLRDITLRSLKRRKAKAAFVLAGLLIGVSTIVALVSLVDATNTDIQHKLEKYGANILVVPKTENLSLTYGGLSLGGVSFEMQEIRQEELEKIGGIKNAANVAALGPMVLGVVDINGRNVLLTGVDFEATKILKPWWKITGETPGENGVLLGSGAADILGLSSGDTLEIEGHDLRITGIIEPTGSQDDQLLFAQLATAQGILGKEGMVSMAEVAALCNACPIDDMVAQISDALPGANVMAIQQVVKGRMETLGHFKKFSYGISVVVLLVGALVVLVTMMGSVRERTREIGIFGAIGFRRSHIVQIVLLEAAIISAIAGIVGYFAGLGATKLLIPFFTESQNVAIPFDPVLAAASLILAVLIGILASAYPAMIAARLDPNEALRAL
jgi:putative ABC transport system permease protein